MTAHKHEDERSLHVPVRLESHRRRILTSIVAALIVACAGILGTWGAVAIESFHSTTASNSGLFYGVNDYTSDNYIRDLEFAVNDAIAEAHMFSVILRQIRPTNIFLVISGEPNRTNATRLSTLRALGANVWTNATKSAFYSAMRGIEARAKEKTGFAVISLSAHGFEFNRKAFVLPQDALIDEPQTCLSVEAIKERFDELPAEKGS